MAIPVEGAHREAAADASDLLAALSDPLQGQPAQAQNSASTATSNRGRGQGSSRARGTTSSRRTTTQQSTTSNAPPPKQRSTVKRRATSRTSRAGKGGGTAGGTSTSTSSATPTQPTEDAEVSTGTTDNVTGDAGSDSPAALSTALVTRPEQEFNLPSGFRFAAPPFQSESKDFFKPTSVRADFSLVKTIKASPEGEQRLLPDLSKSSASLVSKLTDKSTVSMKKVRDHVLSALFHPFQISRNSNPKSFHPLTAYILAETSKIHDGADVTKNLEASKGSKKDGGNDEFAELPGPANQYGGLNYARPPITTVYEIADDMARKATDEETDFGIAFQNASKCFDKYGLRIFTMCSGTEAPILSMELLQEALSRRGKSFNYQHIASAEIVPFKQSYIQLNFDPEVIFRDVTELGNSKATTAYGRMAKVPDECHIVIAGSACVDFSTLNNTPKSFGAKGESWSTMVGIMYYCIQHTPPAVIMENVMNAKWKEICHFWYEKLGYDVRAVLVDTKNFYIPQTRARGYLVAINREHAAATGIDTSRLLDNCKLYLGGLQHRASVPYTDVIYAHDSVENQVAREQRKNQVLLKRPRHDWELCYHRHNTLRGAYGIGLARPFTQWNENGTLVPIGDVEIEFIKKLLHRELDFLDIAGLRYYSQRDFDTWCKSRVLDISQNIDREIDSKHWGIVGCVTPAGQNFDTRRGGPLGGREALMLQGIPVDDLVLDKLTHRNMTDLAGNAMTTSVIGCITMAVMAAACQDVNCLFQPPKDLDHRQKPVFRPEEVPQPVPLEENTQDWQSAGLIESWDHLYPEDSGRCQKAALVELYKAAYDCRQLCSCEGVRGTRASIFYLCEDCGYTACSSCKGNPPHKYVELNTDNRPSPDEFIRSVQDNIPRSVHIEMQNLAAVVKKVTLAKTSREMLGLGVPELPVDAPEKKSARGRKAKASKVTEVVSKAGPSTTKRRATDVGDGESRQTKKQMTLKTWATRDVEMADVANATYENPKSNVDVVGDKKAASKAKPPVYGPKDTFAQFLYNNRNVLDKDPDELNGRLQESIVKAFSASFHFRSIERNSMGWKVLFSSNHGRLEFHIPTKCSIKDLGESCFWLLYAIPLPNEPLGSRVREQLRRPVAQMSVRKRLFQGEWILFQPHHASNVMSISGKDPVDALQQRIGVHSRSNDVFHVYKTLTIAASGSKTITFQYLQDCGTANGLLYKCISTRKKAYLFLDPYHLQDGRFDSMVIAGDISRLSPEDDRLVDVKFAPGWQPVVLNGPATMEWEVTFEPIAAERVSLRPTYFGPAYQELLVPIWKPKTKFIDLFKYDEDHENPCKRSASPLFAVTLPQYPELKKSFGDYQEELTDHAIDLDLKDRRGKLTPLAWLLHALQIPETLQVDHFVPSEYVQDTACENCAPAAPSVQWEMVQQRKTLVLRPFENDAEAADREQKLKARPPLASLEINFNQGEVQMCLSFNIPSLVHRALAPLLRGATNDPNPTASWKIVRYNRLDEQVAYSTPKLKSNETDASDSAPRCFKRELKGNQGRTLTWMKSVEQGKTWTQHNTVSHAVKALSWKALASAEYDSKVYGGLIADGIGTGKTTVAYSLVGNDVDTKAKGPKSLEVSRCLIRATLILVPNNLVDQWYTQAEHCFNHVTEPGDEEAPNDAVIILRIADIAALKKLSVEDLKRAHIILAGHGLLKSKDYWQNLRRLCCSPDIPTSGGRALMQWLKDAGGKIKDLSDNSSNFSDFDALNSKRAEIWGEQNFRKRPFMGFSKRDMKGLDLYAVDKKPKKKEAEAAGAQEVPGDSEDAQEETKAKAQPLQSGEMQSVNPKGRVDVENDKKNNDEKPPLPMLRTDNQKTILPLLHLFSFRRVIIDEFQYLDQRSVAAAVAMSAQSRWLLSGTPPISTVDDVDQIARLIGTRISSRPNEAVITGFANKSAGLTTKEKSYAEEFEEYNDIVSLDTLNLQTKRAVDFLLEFSRKNRMQRKVPSSKPVVMVRPTHRELANFCLFFRVINKVSVKYDRGKKMEPALEAYVKATEFSFGAKKKLVGPQEGSLYEDPVNASRAIIELTAAAPSAEMLLSCCSRWIRRHEDLGASPGTYEPLFEEAEREVKAEIENISVRAREAFWYYLQAEKKQRLLQKCDLPQWCSDLLQGDLLGDMDVTKILDQILGHAHENRREPPGTGVFRMMTRWLKNPGKVAWDYKDKTKREREMAARTSDLAKASRRLLFSSRSMRLMHSIDQISNGLGACAECGSLLEDENRVLLECGHIQCTECSEDAPLPGSCAVRGCRAAISGNNLLKASIFTKTAPREDPGFGSRSEAITGLINEILAECAHDCVLVFLQFEPQIEDLRCALEREEIAFADGCGPAAQANIKAFLYAILAYNASLPAGTPAYHADLAAVRVEVEKERARAAGKETEPERERREEREKEAAEEAKGEKRQRVLLLRIDSEDAAGWNLQVCSHVIIAAPYLQKSTVLYKAVLDQAVGRSLRYGQEKPVHVYQVVTLFTTEVHVLEAAERKVLVEVEGEKERGRLVEEKDVRPDEARFGGPRLTSVPVGAEMGEEGEEDEEGEGEGAEQEQESG